MVNTLIKQDSSPEQISNRLFMEQDILKHEWIHLYIDKNKRQGGDLHKHLRCQKKRRKRMANKIAGDISRTVSALSNALLF